ncbi:hypothetical protein FOMA001_g2261 [Fusarium oxysporum f. sp. matthiolae]|nr:hypothetical protein FOMA001_g2261 [Fusarium oxysporum f. sp. matthiolae]
METEPAKDSIPRTMTLFTALPLEIQQNIARHVLNPRKLARSLGFPLPKLHKKVGDIWDLFFKDRAWLNNASPSILVGHVGEVLRTITHEGFEDYQVGHVCFIYEGLMDIAEFQRCLHPNVLHTHGRTNTYDYAFTAHGITLNLHCAFTPNLNHPVYTKWPERLSQPNHRGRQAAYIIYGEQELREAQVLGLGANLQSPESVSRACWLKFPHLGDNNGIVVCSEDFSLFRKNHTLSQLVYADNYGERFKEFIINLLERDENNPSKSQCEACRMEGNETFDSW